MKRHLRILSCAGLIAVTNAQSAVMAAENGVTNYPAGSPGSYITEFPPIPGIFMLSQTNHAFADALYDANGNKLPVPFSLSGYAETVRLLAAYPGELFGAKVYSQLVLPLVHLETDTLAGSQSANGLANVTVSPFILSWTREEHYFTLGLDIATSWAQYSPTRLSVGTGYSSVMPVMGYRYDMPDGLDFGALARLEFNTENDATNYRSGTTLMVDGVLGWNFGPWKLGVVAGYTEQLADDRQNGVNIGNRLKQFALGPSVAYRTGPYVFNVNYQPNLYAENGANVSTVWANVALPLWTPKPPLDKPGSEKD